MVRHPRDLIPLLERVQTKEDLYGLLGIGDLGPPQRAKPTNTVTWVQGTFAMTVGTGNQTVDTGSGITGKILILWGTSQTGQGFAANQVGFFGVATSSTSRGVIAWCADDNLATTDVAKGTDNGFCLRVISDATTPTVDSEADFVDFSTGGAGRFTINITNAPAAADIVHYIMICDTDITNAIVLQKSQSTSLGSFATTGAGFKPDFGLFFGTDQTANGNSTGYGCFIGASDAHFDQGSCTWTDTDGSTMTTHPEHYSSITSCIALEAPAAINSVANLTSFDTDGYTLNWSDAAASAWLYYALLVKGGSWSVDSFLAPATTIDQSVTTNFTPKGVFFFGTGTTTAAATEAAESHICMGAMGQSPIEELAAWWSSDDTINSDSNRNNSITKCILKCTNPSTVTLDADAKTLDTSGWTITWTTTVNTARFFAVAVGNTLNIVGVTKDTSGSVLATCDTYCFKESAVGTIVFNSYVASDGSGNYTHKVNDNTALYFVVAFKSGSPNRMDVTDRVLAGA